MSKTRQDGRRKRGLIRGKRRMERDPRGFDIVQEPVAIGLSFLPEDTLNLNGSTCGHLDVSCGSIMSSEYQHAGRSFFKGEHKIDEMFRVVEVQFQARDGSPGSDLFLMVVAGGLKEFRDSDKFNETFTFNGLPKKRR